MSTGTKLILVIILWLVIIPASQVWAVKYGSPQSVWFYCQMLRWCTP